MTGDINIQVNIVAFGKEDVSYLTDKEIEDILYKGLKGPERYVEIVHCNKDKNEYKNIYVSNRKNKSGSIMVYNGFRVLN